MTSLARLLVWALLIGAPSVATAQASKDRRVCFNENWLFLKGEAQGAEATGFADSTWRHLTLPHDWAIEGPFDKQYGPNTGGLPVSGTGWYRKHFTLAAAE